MGLSTPHPRSDTTCNATSALGVHSRGLPLRRGRAESRADVGTAPTVHLQPKGDYMTRAATTVTESFVTCPDGTRLFVRRSGSGDDVILVPNGLYYVDDLATTAPEATWIAFDLRHRGRSQSPDLDSGRDAGIEQDVEDIESLRAAFELRSLRLIGHSYVASVAALYAMRHPGHVERLVMISPPAPDPTNAAAADPPDGVVTDVMARLGALQQAPPSDPVARCRAFWDAIRRLYVYREEHAPRIDWGRCELPQERAFLRRWTEVVEPSLRRWRPGPVDFAALTRPVLVVHGEFDRSAPIGGGVDWCKYLPSAWLLRVPESAHAPWLEAPDIVLPALTEFLSGSVPRRVAGSPGAGSA